MEENIWDGYGRWDEFAKLDDVQAIKDAISAVKLWRANYVSPAQQYAFGYANDEILNSEDRTAPTIVDFGCGLGRNGRMLRKHFPRVVGFDLPEMLEKLGKYSSNVVDKVYDVVYSSVDELLAKEKFCALYDSVALQHILDASYVAAFIEKLMTNPHFRTIVSIYFNAENQAPHLLSLPQRGWSVWHLEDDTLSFEGAPHKAAIFRRW